jgi:histidine triad (HIT) family protein
MSEESLRWAEFARQSCWSGRMSIEGTYDRTNVFAKILRGEAPVAKVCEDTDVLAFMDLFPQSTGHVVVIPKASTARNILEVDALTLQQLIEVVQKIAKAAHAALQADGVIVTQFNGEAAGQTVCHLHFHVIPCWAGRPLKGHGVGKRADMDYLHGLAARIAASL